MLTAWRFTLAYGVRDLGSLLRTRAAAVARQPFLTDS